MRNLPLLIGAGLVAGAVGFYAGLIALLALTGLDAPGWAPVAQLVGVGLLAGGTSALVAGNGIPRTATLALGAALIGGVVGLVVMEASLSFELAIAAGVVLVIAAAFGADTAANG